MRTSWFVPVASALAAAFCVAALALPAPEAVSTAQPSPSGVRGIEWYKHSRWTADDGSPTEVTSVVQDGAGFLWLAGAEGLFRFDGLRFDRLEPAAAQAATGARPVSLAVARSGDVLVGYDHSGGVAMVVQGRLVDTAMPNPPPMITALVGDYQGGQLAFWGSAVGERAWQYRRGRWTAVSGRWGLPLGAVSLPYVTRDGALLLGIFNPDDRRTSIGVIRPGGRLEIVEAPGEVPSFAEDGRGRLWISDKVGIRRLLVADRSVRVGPLVHEAVAGLRYAPVAFERDGSMWGAAVGVGAFRIGDPGGGRPLERADQSGGLTSDLTTSILIDREGSVWIGTQAGLDKFQKAAMAHETMVPRQSFGGFLGTAQADDGTRFFVVDSALYGVRPGSSSAVRIPVPPKDWQRGAR